VSALKIIRLVWAQVLVIALIFYLYGIAVKIYPKKITQTHVHKTLYIDREFEQSYIDTIQIAANRWTEATNHLAEFDIVLMPVSDLNKLLDDKDAIIVTDFSQDNPYVVGLDGNNSSQFTVALYTIQPPIPTLAYVSGRITEQMFEKVTMHELGHSLGLEHVTGDQAVGQIMCPNITCMSETISQGDLEQFCNIYKCDASTLHGEKPISL